MTTMDGRPTPPRGTTRVTGQGAANMAPCPGCGEGIDHHAIACKPCFKRIPGALKEQLANAPSGTTERKRIVARMREHLREHAAGGAS